jgi:hypothetical protein
MHALHFPLSSATSAAESVDILSMPDTDRSGWRKPQKRKQQDKSQLEKKEAWASPAMSKAMDPSAVISDPLKNIDLKGNPKEVNVGHSDDNEHGMISQKDGAPTHDLNEHQHSRPITQTPEMKRPATYTLNPESSYIHSKNGSLKNVPVITPSLSQNFDKGKTQILDSGGPTVGLWQSNLQSHSMLYFDAGTQTATGPNVTGGVQSLNGAESTSGVGNTQMSNTGFGHDQQCQVDAQGSEPLHAQRAPHQAHQQQVDSSRISPSRGLLSGSTKILGQGEVRNAAQMSNPQQSEYQRNTSPSTDEVGLTNPGLSDRRLSPQGSFPGQNIGIISVNPHSGSPAQLAHECIHGFGQNESLPAGKYVQNVSPLQQLPTSESPAARHFLMSFGQGQDVIQKMSPSMGSQGQGVIQQTSHGQGLTQQRSPSMGCQGHGVMVEQTSPSIGFQGRGVVQQPSPAMGSQGQVVLNPGSTPRIQPPAYTSLGFHQQIQSGLIQSPHQSYQSPQQNVPSLLVPVTYAVQSVERQAMTSGSPAQSQVQHPPCQQGVLPNVNPNQSLPCTFQNVTPSQQDVRRPSPNTNHGQDMKRSTNHIISAPSPSMNNAASQSHHQQQDLPTQHSTNGLHIVVGRSYSGEG